MKQLVFLLALLNCYVISISQENQMVVCQYGFTFEISVQKNWGYLQPVILSVVPNSSAEAAGLRSNDIIEKINEKSTTGENIETISSWLHNSNFQIQLNVSNLKERDHKIIVNKECRLKNSLSEKDLANVYSFYSLEDVQTHAFTCPFKTSVNTETNLMQYSSFGFAAPDSENIELEKNINDAIRKSLEEKGLKYTTINPDLMIKTYYSQMANPNFRNNPQAEKFPLVYRYNVYKKTMEKIPIYYNPLIHTDQAKFFLKFGIKLIDNKKNINLTIWECEANELLQSNYSLSDYAEFHIPLMFMQYPYMKSKETAQFYYSRSKYNYTGIHFNIDNLKEITEVDSSSPAAKSEIKAGDIIEKINGINFVNNVKAADNNYKQFIYKTSSFRDQSTQFTNAEGFTRCMYWDKMKYAQIQDEFRKPEFSTTFSYLFYFRPYINLSGTNIISFNIKRGSWKEEIKVRPVIITEEIFENR